MKGFQLQTMLCGAVLSVVMADVSAAEDFSGDYTLKDRGAEGTLKVKHVENGTLKFSVDTAAGTCMGSLEEAIADVSGQIATFKDADSECVMKITFSGNTALLEETSLCNAHHGLRCTFDGKYRRAAEKKSANRSKGEGWPFIYEGAALALGMTPEGLKAKFPQTSLPDDETLDDAEKKDKKSGASFWVVDGQSDKMVFTFLGDQLKRVRISSSSTEGPTPSQLDFQRWLTKHYGKGSTHHNKKTSEHFTTWSPPKAKAQLICYVGEDSGDANCAFLIQAK